MTNSNQPSVMMTFSSLKGTLPPKMAVEIMCGAPNQTQFNCIQTPLTSSNISFMQIGFLSLRNFTLGLIFGRVWDFCLQIAPPPPSGVSLEQTDLSQLWETARRYVGHIYYYPYYLNSILHHQTFSMHKLTFRVFYVRKYGKPKLGESTLT